MSDFKNGKLPDNYIKTPLSPCPFCGQVPYIWVDVRERVHVTMFHSCWSGLVIGIDRNDFTETRDNIEQIVEIWNNRCQ